MSEDLTTAREHQATDDKKSGRWLARLRRGVVLLAIWLAIFVATVFAWRAIRFSDLLYDGVSIRVVPEDDADFAWPFYLYVPASGLDNPEQPIRVLVRPNNTGRTDDDPEVHDEVARREALSSRAFAEDLGMAVLVPAFPRPEQQWKIYTHALDRDVVVTKDSTLSRLDLQLLAMIDEARARLAARGLEVAEKVVIQGFSAGGMFANRFTLIHPDHVHAAIIGAPGGWPMLPVDTYAGQPLRYPIGTADFDTLFGRPFGRDIVRSVPMFFFQGALDENDSVPYADSYDPADAETVRNLFGESLVERWERAEEVYEQEGFCSRFELYAGVGHEIRREIEQDIEAFIRRNEAGVAADCRSDESNGSGH